MSGTEKVSSVAAVQWGISKPVHIAAIQARLRGLMGKGLKLQSKVCWNQVPTMPEKRSVPLVRNRGKQVKSFVPVFKMLSPQVQQNQPVQTTLSSALSAATCDEKQNKTKHK